MEAWELLRWSVDFRGGNGSEMGGLRGFEPDLRWICLVCRIGGGLELLSSDGNCSFLGATCFFHNMSAKPIREYDAKLLLAYHLSRVPQFGSVCTVRKEFTSPDTRVAQVSHTLLPPALQPRLLPVPPSLCLENWESRPAALAPTFSPIQRDRTLRSSADLWWFIRWRTTRRRAISLPTRNYPLGSSPINSSSSRINSSNDVERLVSCASLSFAQHRGTAAHFFVGYDSLLNKEWAEGKDWIKARAGEQVQVRPIYPLCEIRADPSGG